MTSRKFDVFIVPVQIQHLHKDMTLRSADAFRDQAELSVSVAPRGMSLLHVVIRSPLKGHMPSCDPDRSLSHPFDLYCF